MSSNKQGAKKAKYAEKNGGGDSQGCGRTVPNNATFGVLFNILIARIGSVILAQNPACQISILENAGKQGSSSEA
uniref:Uncharacterized protein n=1 Tax=Romanomermis culicivorax TaxID=13658 RepID=A0A915ISB5_ROMCU